MTRRVFETKHDLPVFCKEKDNNFKNDLDSKKFIAGLTYLTNIFEVLKNLFFQKG